jgi:hypothetical protein
MLRVENAELDEFVEGGTILVIHMNAAQRIGACDCRYSAADRCRGLAQFRLNNIPS